MATTGDRNGAPGCPSVGSERKWESTMAELKERRSEKVAQQGPCQPVGHARVTYRAGPRGEGRSESSGTSVRAWKYRKGIIMIDGVDRRRTPLLPGVVMSILTYRPHEEYT